MRRCEQCGKEVLFPFECSYCGKILCSEHRLPESHQCVGMPKESGYWYRKKRAMGGAIEKEGQEQIREGEFYFIKEDKKRMKRDKGESYRRAPRNRLSRIFRNAKTVGILAVSLIILGVFILSWTNFFAQIIMPHFTDTTQIENEIFRLINIERVDRGLPALLKDEALTTIALEWSREMAKTGNLTHGDFESRITGIGYLDYQCGEIIGMYGGWATNLGREFVDMWLHSYGHYQIMMTPSSGYMGVGVSKGSQGFFAVVDFRFV